MTAPFVRVPRRGNTPLRRPWNFDRDVLGVKRHLVELDITLADIAKKSGKRPGTVANVLCGATTSWYIETAVRELIDERRREQLTRAVKVAGGLARSAMAPRKGGRFAPAGSPAERERRRVSTKTPAAGTTSRTTSSRVRLTLKDLPKDTVWWSARAAQFPEINLHDELEKAQDWYGADRIKSPKLFFRNWLAKATPRSRDMSPEEIRERLAVVS